MAIYDYIQGGSAASNAKSGAYVGADVEMDAVVGSTDDAAKVPVYLTLVNPGVEITAYEANLEIYQVNEGVVADESLEGSVEKFIFSGRRALVENNERWAEDHAGVYFKGTALHGKNALFISITNQYLDPFEGEEGVLMSVFFDASDFEDGDYIVRAFGLLAVGTDKASHKAADVDAKFTIKDGKVTAVTALTAEEAVAAGKAIYTLDGKQVAAPQKGQIYVVDGKAVKF